MRFGTPVEIVENPVAKVSNPFKVPRNQAPNPPKEPKCGFHCALGGLEILATGYSSVSIGFSVFAREALFVDFVKACAPGRGGGLVGEVRGSCGNR